MNTAAPNLLPGSVGRRMAAARAARAWGKGLLALSVACGVGVAGAAGLSSPNFDDLRSQSLRLNAAADADFALADRFRKDAVAAGLRLDLQHAVSGHPDWSRLLALIARVRGEEALVESVEVKRRESEPPAAAKAGAKGNAAAQARPRNTFTVRLTGLAADTAGATGLVLRLEQAGVFDRVSLLETQPREVGGLARTAFSIECEIADAAASPRGKAGGKAR